MSSSIQGHLSIRVLLITLVLVVFLNSAGSADEIQTGEFVIRSSSRELLGQKRAETMSSYMPLDQAVEWSSYVPKDYDAENPPGLLVFINSIPSGKILDDWKEVMDKGNLIWVGANQSGNEVNTALRVNYAVMGVAAINRNYRIDPDRVYISGFSGGSRVASMAAIEFAGLFKGAIYNCGVNLWGENKPPALSEVMRNRYVFITGTRDFNLQDTREVFKAYKRAGVPNIKLMVIPGMHHNYPEANVLEEAIIYLDTR